MIPEKLAILFHETYERLAPAFGWKTKKGCKVPFGRLPERNKALMIATCGTILNALQEEVAAVGLDDMKSSVLAANGPRSSRSGCPQAVTPAANTSLEDTCPYCKGTGKASGNTSPNNFHQCEECQ